MRPVRPAERPGRSRACSRARVAGVLLPALLVTGAAADEWSVTPRLNQRVIGDDNPMLRVDGEQAVGSITELAAELGWRTGTSSAVFTPRYRVNRYDNLQDALNNEYQYYDLDASTSTERLRVGLQGNVTHDTTNSTEAVEAEGQRTLQDVAVDRAAWSVRPYLTYVLTERATARLDASISATDYNDPRAVSSYVDYAYRVVNGSLGYALTERDTVQGILYYSSYERPLFRFPSQKLMGVTDSVGVQLGWERAFTETLRGSLAAGGVRSEFSADAFRFPNGLELELFPDSTDYGQLITASLTQRLERTEWDLGLTRNLTPTGDGVLVTRDELRTALRHRWDPRTSARVELVALQDDNEGVAASNRDYARAQVGVSYRLTPYWTLSGDYRYVYQKYETADDSATSNALWVTIAYQGDKWAVSR